jgi:hypothetical protein
MEILPLDIRDLLGCDYDWSATNEEEGEAADPSASGGFSRSIIAGSARRGGSARYDKSRSLSPVLNPNDFVKWDVLAPDSIRFDKIDLPADINLTTNFSFHTVAILLFMDPVLAGKWPEKKDALYAGWMATFKHPINNEELKRPPCVGPSAYNDEEQDCCSATLQYYVDGMDAVQRAARGIPDSAVTTLARRRSGRAPACGIEASAHPHGRGAPGGVRRDGASATGGRGSGRGSASTTSGP